MGSTVSALGRYAGFTTELFDDCQRSSCYVAMRDGVNLAVDIFRPTTGGKALEDALPALWTHTRYQRASLTEQGEVLSTVENWDGWLFSVIRHGYVVVTVDVRGSGASFGVNEGQYSANENRDSYDLTQWIARQSWCDGNVGMYGRSYLGITQYFAASQSPPNLKAIFPEMASFDHYQYAYSGGVFRESSRFNWQLLVGNMDQSVPIQWKGDYQGSVVPVDDDANGQLLEQALREHRSNLDWFRMLKASPYRDSVDPVSREQLHQTRSAYYYRTEIERSNVPIYHLAGWYDMFPRDTLLWWHNLNNPQKVVIGPWFHVDRQHLDDAAEHLRWYDYWLKGIDNGVMQEDAMHYWTIDAAAGEEWRSTDQWPLKQEVRTPFYLSGGPTGTVDSANDGALAREPISTNSVDEYITDYSTTTGLINRWANANGGPTGYPDMRDNDCKGLTYTTGPLAGDVEVTGHPVIHLWITSSVEDGVFYAYLEDVHPSGFSQYVTEGALLASHRKLSDAPWDNLGLPYHSGLRADVEPLTGDVEELVFDLHPTSKRFPAGHRIRITVTAADGDNDQIPKYDPPPTIKLYRDAQHQSKIVLPINSDCSLCV